MTYQIRCGAEEFPLQIIISIIYPCNLGCPFCPYTDGNSEIRKWYHERGGDLISPDLFKKIADEAAPYRAFLRCTGGGEPTLHPSYFEMAEYAKKGGARIWLNTNGTLLGPHSTKTRRNLERLLDCGVDLIEFSVDAGDAETYSIVRPPIKGKGHEHRWRRLVDGVRYALSYRKAINSKTRIVVSIIMDDLIKDKIAQTVTFWLHDVGVDEVIKRKYLTWDHNTNLPLNHSALPDLYAAIDHEDRPQLPPCVWPFERLNIDTLGRVALCGQDISFTTSSQFPNVHDHSIKEIWQGPAFQSYRQAHLDGRGEEVLPCKNCSAWKAGIRDWNHGWLNVLETADHRRRSHLDLSQFIEVGERTEVIKNAKDNRNLTT